VWRVWLFAGSDPESGQVQASRSTRGLVACVGFSHLATVQRIPGRMIKVLPSLWEYGSVTRGLSLVSGQKNRRFVSVCGELSES